MWLAMWFIVMVGRRKYKRSTSCSFHHKDHSNYVLTGNKDKWCLICKDNSRDLQYHPFMFYISLALK